MVRITYVRPFSFLFLYNTNGSFSAIAVCTEAAMREKLGKKEREDGKAHCTLTCKFPIRQNEIFEANFYFKVLFLGMQIDNFTYLVSLHGIWNH